MFLRIHKYYLWKMQKHAKRNVRLGLGALHEPFFLFHKKRVNAIFGRFVPDTIDRTSTFNAFNVVVISFVVSRTWRRPMRDRSSVRSSRIIGEKEVQKKSRLARRREGTTSMSSAGASRNTSKEANE